MWSFPNTIPRWLGVAGKRKRKVPQNTKQPKKNLEQNKTPALSRGRSGWAQGKRRTAIPAGQGGASRAGMSVLGERLCWAPRPGAAPGRRQERGGPAGAAACAEELVPAQARPARHPAGPAPTWAMPGGPAAPVPGLRVRASPTASRWPSHTPRCRHL